MQKNVIGSVMKALDLLEVFSRDEPALGVSELSERLRLPKATISRLLLTLSLRGYVRQEPHTGKYRLAMRAWETGYVACAQYGLREAAHPVMERMRALAQETVQLAILSDDGYAVCLDRVPGILPLHYDIHVGDRMPSYCTAVGKALLAYQPDDLVRRLLKGRLNAFTASTPASPGAVKHALAEVQGRGFAVNHGEWRADISGVAAPVRTHTGEVLAAVGVGLPTFRLTVEVLESLVTLVVKAAEEISTALGYLGGRTPRARESGS